MKESNNQRFIWKSLPMCTTMFRVNTGTATAGKADYRQGFAIVHDPRPITLGFATSDGKPLSGTSDLVGWTERVITPDMVGKKVAVFTVIETKESGGGVKRQAQKDFIALVKSAGGLAGFAKNVQEAHDIIRGEA